MDLEIHNGKQSGEDKREIEGHMSLYWYYVDMVETWSKKVDEKWGTIKRHRLLFPLTISRAKDTLIHLFNYFIIYKYYGNIRTFN